MKQGYRNGLAMTVVGSAPFLIGATLYEPTAGTTTAAGTSAVTVSGPSVLPPCPFLALTGLPCPLCGATRAVALFAHGDSAFWSYNPFWVFFLIALALVGVLVLCRAWRDRELSLPAPLRTTKGALGAASLVLGLGWAVGLAHADAIAP